jgi:hypothetical protein
VELEPLPPQLAALKELAAAEPDSDSRRFDLLLQFLAFPALHADPRRIEHVRWYVEHNPRGPGSRSPMVHVESSSSPEGFAEIESLWLRHLAASPDDANILMGLASLQASSDRELGCATLRSYLSAHPDAGAVWFELGRVACNRTERLDAFLRAKGRAFDHPNLLPWLAAEAAEVGDRETATQVADELLQQCCGLRAMFGGKLEWSDQGEALWLRARGVMPDDRSARELVSAIAAHAHAKHHAHTALGLVALLDGQADVAARHLLESAEVGSDYRLSSYGPRLTLARKLCELGRWVAALAFLRRCETFWEDERLPAWIQDLERNIVPGAWLPGSEP